MEIDAISIRSFDSPTKKAGMAAGSTMKLQCCCASATDQSRNMQCFLLWLVSRKVATILWLCNYASLSV